MSIFSEVFGGMRRIVLLDDRVTRLQGDVDDVKGQVREIAGRVARIEGLFEMAMYHEDRRIKGK